MDPFGPSIPSWGGNIYPPAWANQSDEHMRYFLQGVVNAGLDPYSLGHNPDTNPYWKHGYNPWTYSGIGKGYACDKYGNPMMNQWYEGFYPLVGGQLQPYMNPGLWTQFWQEQEARGWHPWGQHGGHGRDDFERLRREHDRLSDDIRDLREYAQEMEEEEAYDDAFSDGFWGGYRGGFGHGYSGGYWY